MFRRGWIAHLSTFIIHLKMKLFVAGLSYKTAPVAVREKLAVPAGRLRCYGCRLKLRGNLAEVVVVSTCNRVELMAWPRLWVGAGKPVPGTKRDRSGFFTAPLHQRGDCCNRALTLGGQRVGFNGAWGD